MDQKNSERMWVRAPATRQNFCQVAGASRSVAVMMRSTRVSDFVPLAAFAFRPVVRRIDEPLLVVDITPDRHHDNGADQQHHPDHEAKPPENSRPPNVFLRTGIEPAPQNGNTGQSNNCRHCVTSSHKLYGAFARIIIYLIPIFQVVNFMADY